jgi:hypothetical protein
MTETPVGQMTWRPPGQAEPFLHLRTSMVPDPPHMSAGYATFVRLLQQQWQVIK